MVFNQKSLGVGWARSALSYPHEFFAPFSQSVFYDGRRAGDEGLYPHPLPLSQKKAFWERGIILLKIRGDNSERSVPTLKLFN